MLRGVRFVYDLDTGTLVMYHGGKVVARVKVDVDNVSAVMKKLVSRIAAERGEAGEVKGALKELVDSALIVIAAMFRDGSVEAQEYLSKKLKEQPGLVRQLYDLGVNVYRFLSRLFDKFNIPYHEVLAGLIRKRRFERVAEVVKSALKRVPGEDSVVERLRRLLEEVDKIDKGVGLLLRMALLLLLYTPLAEKHGTIIIHALDPTGSGVLADLVAVDAQLLRPEYAALSYLHRLESLEKFGVPSSPFDILNVILGRGESSASEIVRLLKHAYENMCRVHNVAASGEAVEKAVKAMLEYLYWMPENLVWFAKPVGGYCGHGAEPVQLWYEEVCAILPSEGLPRKIYKVQDLTLLENKLREALKKVYSITEYKRTEKQALTA